MNEFNATVTKTEIKIVEVVEIIIDEKSHSSCQEDAFDFDYSLASGAQSQEQVKPSPGSMYNCTGVNVP